MREGRYGPRLVVADVTGSSRRKERGTAEEAVIAVVFGVWLIVLLIVWALA